ncbi:MAG: tetratricopeptide repeat protein [bacterium]
MKKIYILIIITSLFACSKGVEVVKTQAPQPKVARDIYSVALEHAVAFEKSGFTDQKEYSNAISGFQEVILKDKSNADAWFNIGSLFFCKQDMQRSEEAIKKAIMYRSNFVEAYSLLTKLYLVQGNIQYAMSVAEMANETLPDSDILMNSLAVLYIKSGNLDSAKKMAENIIKKNTKFAPAYVTLGNIYYLNHNYEMARFIYQKAIEQDYVGGDIYTNIGIITSKLDEKGSSLGYFMSAVENSPNNPDVRNNLGEYYLSVGDYEGSLKEFNMALKFNPRMVQALVNTAIAYTRVKLFDEAEQNYKKAMSYDPSFAELYFNYAVFLSDHRGDNTQALSFFNKFILLKGKEISDKHRVYRYIEEINRAKK